MVLGELVAREEGEGGGGGGEKVDGRAGVNSTTVGAKKGRSGDEVMGKEGVGKDVSGDWGRGMGEGKETTLTGVQGSTVKQGEGFGGEGGGGEDVGEGGEGRGTEEGGPRSCVGDEGIGGSYRRTDPGVQARGKDPACGVLEEGHGVWGGNTRTCGEGREQGVTRTRRGEGEEDVC